MLRYKCQRSPWARTVRTTAQVVSFALGIPVGAPAALPQDFPSGYLLRGVTSVNPEVLLGGDTVLLRQLDPNYRLVRQLRALLQAALVARGIQVYDEPGGSFFSPRTLVCETFVGRGTRLTGAQEFRGVFYATTAFFVDEVSVVGRPAPKNDSAITWRSDVRFAYVPQETLLQRLLSSIEECAQDFAAIHAYRNGPR